ncbi:hypothetical protein M409DRAFT_60565 [Zasmidium cellare ATCC 36951]|uniref:Uncharacterized protein n=1 Tax=Zasmidium cellare ATCC 36951 TaxID=1080233 RepID=A0A6A6C0W3_ZASCE|nr:uncharacterized protein M409DRAFT_60565 [Zasmidium cellare ATCC 36951]KAF2159800.1 hypothetical protein M409DRAFT_60565 [Zasmidium cellare ATCC 36951]
MSRDRRLRGCRRACHRSYRQETSLGHPSFDPVQALIQIVRTRAISKLVDFQDHVAVKLLVSWQRGCGLFVGAAFAQQPSSPAPDGLPHTNTPPTARLLALATAVSTTQPARRLFLAEAMADSSKTSGGDRPQLTTRIPRRSAATQAMFSIRWMAQESIGMESTPTSRDKDDDYDTAAESFASSAEGNQERGNPCRENAPTSPRRNSSKKSAIPMPVPTAASIHARSITSGIQATAMAESKLPMSIREKAIAIAALQNATEKARLALENVKLDKRMERGPRCEERAAHKTKAAKDEIKAPKQPREAVNDEGVIRVDHVLAKVEEKAIQMDLTPSASLKKDQDALKAPGPRFKVDCPSYRWLAMMMGRFAHPCALRLQNVKYALQSIGVKMDRASNKYYVLRPKSNDPAMASRNWKEVNVAIALMKDFESRDNADGKRPEMSQLGRLLQEEWGFSMEMLKIDCRCHILDT